MLFNEIYGTYYNAVARVLGLAIRGELTEKRLDEIVHEIAFSESFLTIIPALKNGKWQLIAKDADAGVSTNRTEVSGSFNKKERVWRTKIKRCPTRPLTIPEKRWLKAISMDPRIRLFETDDEGALDIRNLFGSLEGTEPLFTRDDYVIFDKYADGDPYEDEEYIRHFQTILKAIRKGGILHIKYPDRHGGIQDIEVRPLRLEYSEKDDKFRLISRGHSYWQMLNVTRIISCEPEKGSKSLNGGNALAAHRIYGDKNRRTAPAVRKDCIVLELIDERNALERAMLHFAHFEKRAEKLPDSGGKSKYRVKVYYDSCDESEMIIRVLSFGPFLKVTEPARFVEQIKQRLQRQKEFCR